MNLNSLTMAELSDYYKTIAGRANKRLERLEKAGLQRGSAYRSAMMSTQRMSSGRGSGRRFSMKWPSNVGELRQRVSAVRTFLSDVTSTPGGVKKVGKKISGTLKSRYGLDLAPEDIRGVFDSALWENLNSRYGSATAVSILGSLKRNQGKIGQVVKDLADKNVYTYDKETGEKSAVYLSPGEDKSLRGVLSYYKGKHAIDVLY